LCDIFISLLFTRLFWLGFTESAKQYRDLLLRLRVAKSTTADYELLKTRFRNNLSIEEVANFKKSTHLFYEREKTANHNLKCLYDLDEPVCRIDARHTGAGAKSAKPDIAGQLPPVLLLAEGSKVMLLWNIWSEAGLHNGLLGEVVDIVYKKGTKPPQLPLFVLVKVSKKHYFGPRLSEDLDACIIPIAPVKAGFIHRGYCTRTQVPLGLADAVTIHKSQGCNVESCVVDIFKEEPNSAPGLAFTALSRCHHLEDMVLAPFDFDRLAMLSRKATFKVRIAELQRLNELFEKTKARYINVPMPPPEPDSACRPRYFIFLFNGDTATSTSTTSGASNRFVLLYFHWSKSSNYTSNNFCSCHVDWNHSNGNIFWWFIEK